MLEFVWICDLGYYGFVVLNVLICDVVGVLHFEWFGLLDALEIVV